MSFSFVLLSAFSNFSFAEVTSTRNKKEIRLFLLFFSRFFVTLSLNDEVVTSRHKK